MEFHIKVIASFTMKDLQYVDDNEPTFLFFFVGSDSF